MLIPGCCCELPDHEAICCQIQLVCVRVCASVHACVCVCVCVCACECVMVYVIMYVGGIPGICRVSWWSIQESNTRRSIWSVVAFPEGTQRRLYYSICSLWLFLLLLFGLKNLYFSQYAQWHTKEVCIKAIIPSDILNLPSDILLFMRVFQ